MIVYLDLFKENDDGDKYFRYENVTAVHLDFDIIKREKWLRIVFDGGEIKQIDVSDIKSMEVR